MSDQTKKMLLTLFQTNCFVVKMQCDGLTHDDSLLQLPFRGNCLNWVLGHMIASREASLENVGQEPMWSKEESDRYQYDTEPITSADDPGIIELERMLTDIKVGFERLKEGINALTDEQLYATDEKGNSLADSLQFAGWHEGYHAGQLEYLRQLAGKNDKVI